MKIHNDAEAATSAQSVNALACTVGNNIVFDENKYPPETTEGKKLLAQELTHVAQQNSDNNIKRVQRTTTRQVACVRAFTSSGGTMVAESIFQ